jgi:hypothetical protein
MLRRRQEMHTPRVKTNTRPELRKVKQDQAGLSKMRDLRSSMICIIILKL